jgi:PmbA protein
MYDLLDYTMKFAEQKGTSQVEAFFTESRSLSALIERKEVRSVDSKFDAGIGVRVLLKKGEKNYLGSAFTMDSRRSGIETMVNEAISIALAKPARKDFKSFHDSRKVQNVENLFDRRISSMEPNEACTLAKDMIESASVSEKIMSISGDILFISYRTAVKNSLGVEAGYSSTIFRASCYVTTKNETSIGSAGDGYSSRILDEERAIEVARHSASMAISQLDPKPMEAGVMDLVIGPDAVASLLENTFAIMIRADQIQRNQSPYIGKIDTVVASEPITITDEGRLSGAVGSKPYDDEGYRTQTTTVAEKGVLKSFLYDVTSASKEGRESTGNALRPSSGDSLSKYAAEPLVAHTNLTVATATESFDSIVSSVKSGIYVRELIGAHTANRITGEFSLSPLVAYRIEKGEIKHAVRETMIGGNIQNVLRNVTAVGKHPKQCEGTCMDTAIISPILKIKNISVSA